MLDQTEYKHIGSKSSFFKADKVHFHFQPIISELFIYLLQILLISFFFLINHHILSNLKQIHKSFKNIIDFFYNSQTSIYGEIVIVFLFGSLKVIFQGENCIVWEQILRKSECSVLILRQLLPTFESSKEKPRNITKNTNEHATDTVYFESFLLIQTPRIYHPRYRFSI